MVSGTSEESASYSVGPQWASVGVLNGSPFFQNARETVDQPPKCRRDHYATRVPVVNPECGDSIPHVSPHLQADVARKVDAVLATAR